VAKRKTFEKVKLLSRNGREVEGPSVTKPMSMVIELPPNPSHQTGKIKIAKFYGRGSDEIADAVFDQIIRFINSKDKILSSASIDSLCRTGATKLLDYTSLLSKSLGRDLSLDDVNRDLIDGYLLHLASGKLSRSSQLRVYEFAKSILVCLQARGVITRKNLFPSNPFPHSRRFGTPVKPYTASERKHLASALREATAHLFTKPTGSLTSDEVAYCVMAVALRTGRNLTPLLEMQVDCLKAHFKQGRRLLVLYKRRGRKVFSHSVGESITSSDALTVLPGTSKIIEGILLGTAEMRASAPAALRDRLWLYRSRARRTLGDVCVITPAIMAVAARKLTEAFDLRDDDGKPLEINVGRMRKTFSNRIYEISNEDVAVAAAAAGHSVSVAANHYLLPGKGAEERWRFMGEIMADELRHGRLGATFDSTPVGGCRDTRNGQYAPKDGSTCTSFLNCFRCREYVVTGDDLRKLFSYYWLLVRERDETPSREWGRRYGHIIRAIDRDVVEAGIRKKLFTVAQVQNARESARVAPHPYWTDRTTLELGA
jgi:hypothetical protein